MSVCRAEAKLEWAEVEVMAEARDKPWRPTQQFRQRLIVLGPGSRHGDVKKP